MKKGWIKCEEMLPPLGEQVIVAYPNAAYNDHCFRTIGTRVDDNYIIGQTTKWSLFETDSILFKPYIICWAYDNGQDLPNPCIYPCCVKD